MLPFCLYISMKTEKTNKVIEIMAPAGSFESLMAAVNAGAGSVYFGAGHLNMRSKSSSNFSLEDLSQISEICNERNIKSYLTVNTVMYDGDLEAMYEMIAHAKKSNITAIIASDISAIQYAQKIEMEVHISTQINVSNIEAVRFYSKFADVIVLARELSLEQTKAICQKIEEEQIKGPGGELVKIEIFVHGALCMAISGKCYLSLHDNWHSANRGACLQNCRRSYTVRETGSDKELLIDNEYIMSPKDLSTIKFVDKILDAGVSVLKIEGRGRSADYVAKTVGIYREAVQAYLDGEFTNEKADAWETELKTVFNRGFWDGYYLGAKFGEWNDRYGSQATRKKIQIGKVSNYFQKAGAAEFLLQSGDLSKGDSIMVIGPTTGVYETVVEEIRLDDKAVGHAEQGSKISMLIEIKLRRNDKLFKVIDVDE